jgi:hypothetical protein
MGQNFDDYTGFQPKTTPAQRNATQCTKNLADHGEHIRSIRQIKEYKRVLENSFRKILFSKKLAIFSK